MTFVITTPLYYVNDKPHLGSVYTTIICDSIARYKRLVGEDVMFITGVDEHGLKIQRTANEKGIEPKSHCDQISGIFHINWKNWDISYDKFIRTSSKNHELVVNEFYERVKASDDIYRKSCFRKVWYLLLVACRRISLFYRVRARNNLISSFCFGSVQALLFDCFLWIGFSLRFVGSQRVSQFCW